MRFLCLVAAALFSVYAAAPASAGVKMLDSFTNATLTDGAFVASANRGLLGYSGGATILTASGEAELVARANRTPTFAGLVYDFSPHQAVLSRVTINAQNQQTSATETGVLSVKAISSTSATQTVSITLPGGAAAANYDFDFTSFGPGVSLARLEVTWDLPSGGTGLRGLTLSQIDLYEVPEPATIALIGLASSCGGFVGYRRRKAAAKKK
jgi:hypothetical protein